MSSISNAIRNKILEVVKIFRVSKIEALENNIEMKTKEFEINSEITKINGKIILGDITTVHKINSGLSISKGTDSGLLLPIEVVNGQKKYIKLYDL